jgi:hypothetical protein
MTKNEIAVASGHMLDDLGESIHLLRWENECDDDYRKRVLGEFMHQDFEKQIEARGLMDDPKKVIKFFQEYFNEI